MLANQSAPTLRQRGQTLNGQISRMREGVPVAIAQPTRLLAQDATTEAFVQSAALAPSEGGTWHDLGTSLFFAGELIESREVYAYGLKQSPRHPGLLKDAALAKVSCSTVSSHRPNSCRPVCSMLTSPVLPA